MAERQQFIDMENGAWKKFHEIWRGEILALLLSDELEQIRSLTFFYYSSTALHIIFFILHNKTSCGALWKRTNKWNYGQDV